MEVVLIILIIIGCATCEECHKHEIQKACVYKTGNPECKKP
jgi:hypothetical protein